MNKIISIAVLVLMVVLILPQATLARKGVGVVWDTETEIVREGSTHCVQYGIYNPWDEDVYAILSVSEDLKNIITNEESEIKLIKAGTLHENAIPIEFCFDIAKIYKENCLIGNSICEQKCEETEVVYEGKIVAMEQPSGSSGGTVGSATSLGVSIPLKLKVKCNSHPTDWTLAYVAIIIVILLLMGLSLRNKKKHKKKK